MPSSVTATFASSSMPKFSSVCETSRVGKVGSITFTVNFFSDSAFSAFTVTVAISAEIPVISPPSTLAIAS